MKKCILILSGLLLTFLSSKAQIVTSGDVLNLAGKTEVNVVFDYSETNLIRTDKTLKNLLKAIQNLQKQKISKNFISSALSMMIQKVFLNLVITKNLKQISTLRSVGYKTT